LKRSETVEYFNIVTGKHVPRRTFLRGMGAAVALPFLDAMVPAGRSWRETVETLDRPRLIAIEQVHGAAGSHRGFGDRMHLWSPAQTGSNFDLSTSSLKPLEPFREYLTIVSNTDVRMAEAYRPSEIGGDHTRSSAVFLTQAHPRQTEGSNVFVGKSLDQIFAEQLGQDTPLPSMQLCIEPVDQMGGCPYNYNCAYTDSISWSSPSEPLPMIRDPRVAFDQLFGAGGSAEARAVRRAERSSILDVLVDQVAEVKRSLGLDDRNRLDQYLNNVRELERRIERTEEQNRSGELREIPEAPAGVPDSFGEHVQMMFDLQVLAFQTDMTRVFSFKMGRDASARTYTESGVDRPFHPLSHFADNEEEILLFAKLNEYHVSMLPYLMTKLEEVVEGEGTLLDKTAIIYGSPMGNPNLHNHRRCPLIFLGGGNGALRGGVHLSAPDGTPMANAMLALLQGLGIRDLQSFGDSTGRLSLDGGGFAVTQ